jgi:phenylpropionate dioxygenase-like ring-hydroxylating dioxygenase large terminal subunit
VSAVDTRTIPWSWYTDPAVLRLEEERIFRHAWQYVARREEIAEPGSFHAVQAGHVPVVLVRDEDGLLRAFLNVCRHRGSLVCEGSGKRATLQCPYHAWTYGLDGRLVAAPRLAREGGNDADELGLLPVQVDTWGPLVFVNPDLDAEPLTEHLGEVPERIAAAGIDLDALRFLRRSDWEVEANWKLSAENFLECYHCPVAHPGFTAAMDVSPDAYLLEVDGGRMTQHGPPRPDAKGGYDLRGEVERGQFHLLFPGTVINVMPGRPNFSIGPVQPLATDRSRRFLDYFVAADADPAWIGEALEFDRQVGAEDSVLIARVQAGVRSGLLHEGRLLPESEQLVAHFQSLVVRALA